MARHQVLPRDSEPATLEDVDRDLKALSEHKSEWAQLPIADKVSLLKEVRSRLLDYPYAYGSRLMDATGAPDTPHEHGTAMTKTVVIPATLINTLINLLEQHVKTGSFHKAPLRTSSTGEQVADVTALSPAFLKSVGHKIETYIQAGKPPSQGLFYSPLGKHSGRVCAVLGAGNQSFLGLSDVLHAMFVEGNVCWFKYHPVLAKTMPYQEHILEPLCSRGYYVGAVCDLPVTQHALYHPCVDCFHMTGGGATHDAIVWGGEKNEQARRKAITDPKLKVPATSELGNVTPWLVVPADWTDKELRHYSKHLAAAFADNCSCNCLSPKVVILAKGWKHTATFCQYFKDEMSAFPAATPYYPGVHARYSKFADHYPEALRLGSGIAEANASKDRFGERLPWLVIEMEKTLTPKIKDEFKDELCFAEEPFAPVITLLQVELESSAADSLTAEYLKLVPEFCNSTLFGSLTCSFLVHPDVEKQNSELVSAAVDRLEYGTVVKNEFSGVAFIMPGAHWGGFQRPSMDLANVGSGIGSIHNAGMYNHPQKSVVHCHWASSSQLQPPHQKSIPPFVMKIVGGLLTSGIWGVIKLFLFSK